MTWGLRLIRMFFVRQSKQALDVADSLGTLIETMKHEEQKERDELRRWHKHTDARLQQLEVAADVARTRSRRAEDPH